VPVNGYGILFNKILDHQNIRLILKTPFSELQETWRKEFDYLVFTGSIDEYFDYCFGALPYRTLRFEKITGTEIQGNAVINYTDLSVPFTRIHEHKWFTPEKKFTKSLAFKEFSSATDSRSNPYYPVENRESLKLYGRYQKLVEKEKNLLLIGRLAQFKYFNMDQVIKSSMDTYKLFRKL
jgi:UDP-galactopyranose mutase